MQSCVNWVNHEIRKVRSGISRPVYSVILNLNLCLCKFTPAQQAGIRWILTTTTKKNCVTPPPRNGIRVENCSYSYGVNVWPYLNSFRQHQQRMVLYLHVPHSPCSASISAPVQVDCVALTRIYVINVCIVWGQELVSGKVN